MVFSYHDMASLTEMYENGKKVSQNSSEAKRLYQMARSKHPHGTNR